MRDNGCSSRATLDFQLGGVLHVIDEERAWGLYEHPRLFNYRTGETLEICADLDGGKQTSSILIQETPPISAFNRATGQLALVVGGKIEVLTP